MPKATAILAVALPGMAQPDQTLGLLALGDLELRQHRPRMAEMYLKQAAEQPQGPLQPYIGLLGGRALAAMDHSSEAISVFEKVAEMDLPPALQRAIWLGLAEAYENRKFYGSAAAAWSHLARIAQERSFRYEAHYREALAVQRAGRTEEAAGLFRRIFLNDLSSPFGHRAGRAYLSLSPPGTRLAPARATSALSLARRLAASGRARDALDVLGDIPSGHLTRRRRKLYDKIRIQALYALRRNKDVFHFAARVRAVYGAAKPSWSCVLQALWTCLRTNDAHKAAGYARFLEDTLPPRDPKRAQARYAMGTLYYARGDFQEALHWLEPISGMNVDRNTRWEAAYKAAWCCYVLEKSAEALRLFSSIAASGPDSLADASAYFEGMLQEKAGRLDLAAPAWLSLASRGGYWSALARGALQSAGAVTHIAPPPKIPAPWNQDFSGENSLLARQLDVAGLSRFAADVYQDVYSRHADDPAVAVTYASLLAEAGRFSAASSVLQGAFPDLQGLSAMPPAALRILYPLPHLVLVRAFAAREDVPAALAYAVIRRESAFDPSILSPAGAVGLMQIMPSTAARMAAQLKKRPPAAHDLTDPSLNLELGLHFLSRRLKEFGGAAAAVASYNAGRQKAAFWLKAFGHPSEAQFVAMIPYSETRSYTEHVLADEKAYEVLLRSAHKK